MPIPFIIGAAALVAGAYGAKKGYDGYQTHKTAMTERKPNSTNRKKTPRRHWPA